jgi:helicase
LTVNKLIKLVLNAGNIEKLNPLQRAALKRATPNENFVVSAPTASGKTLLAELWALHTVLNERKKVLYTCPLRALATEHYSEFKTKYSGLGVKVAISTGDFDSSSHYLSKYDIIFCTNEKVDSLIRHRASWLSEVALLVADEIHELDSDRGPTLEMVIVALRALTTNIRVLALSATIPNADELAKWLGAKLLVSNYRPVKLKEGVLLHDTIYYASNETEQIVLKDNPLTSLIADTLEKRKQALVFVNMRKRAESLAGKLASLTQPLLTPREQRTLERLSQRVLEVLETPTEQCKALASSLVAGVAFHHAGLLAKQRAIVEDAFREGLVKVLVATPTLAAGVNLPSHTVIIPSLFRFSGYGSERIAVREFKQWAGRAGRPRYDKEGRALLIARSDTEFEQLFELYIDAEPEDVESRLSSTSTLRTVLLATIASGLVWNDTSLESLFSKTFFAFQYGNLAELIKMLNSVLDDLEHMGFVLVKEANGTFQYLPTKLGKRVSDLYLDPASAYRMIQLMGEEPKGLGLLYVLVDTTEFMPWLNVPRAQHANMLALMEERAKELPIDVLKEQYRDPHLLSKFYSALMLEAWVEELSEQEIMERFSMPPGALHFKLQMCDWLAYAATELAQLQGLDKVADDMAIMRKRLKAGVRPELLQLVELKGIGRVRARKLYAAKLRGLSDIKRADIEDLARILGVKLALKVKAQLGQKLTLTKQQERELIRKYGAQRRLS